VRSHGNALGSHESDESRLDDDDERIDLEEAASF
jgi:hypothetical protein